MHEAGNGWRPACRAGAGLVDGLKIRCIDQPSESDPVHPQRSKGKTTCSVFRFDDLQEYGRLGKRIETFSIKSGEAIERGTSLGGQRLRSQRDYKSWSRCPAKTRPTASSDDRRVACSN